MAKNQVIAGDYQHKKVIGASGTIGILLGFGKIINLNQTTVSSYEHMSEDHKKGTHIVSIKFTDGKESLIEIDGGIYKVLLQAMFQKSSETTTTKDNTNGDVAVNKKGCRNGCLIFIVLAVIVFVGAIIIALSLSKNPEKYDTSPKYEMVRALGVTAEQAEIIGDILKSVGIEDANIQRDELLDNAHFEGEKGYRLSTREANNVILYMNPDGTIYNIKYADKNLYIDSEVKSSLNDFILTLEEKTDLQIRSQEAIKSILKSPSTAKFPNINDWKFKKEDGLVTLQSYVDAQNAFGATMRSEFQLKVKDGNVTSLIMDGKEYIQQ